MRNPLKNYYFASCGSSSETFECTFAMWKWQNPDDILTNVFSTLREKYGSVYMRSITKL